MENSKIKFPTNEELQIDFKNKIVEIINYIKNFSMYDVLAHFYWEYKISFGNEEEKDERWLKSIKLMYLQILFSCFDKSDHTKELKECNIKRINEYLEEIHSFTIQYGIVFNKENGLTDEENEYLSHSYSFKDWSGKRYDIFEIQHHKDLLDCLEKEFETAYGFTLEDLYSGILNLKNNFYFKFENSINSIRKLVRAKKIKIDDKGVHVIAEFNEKEQQQLNEYFEDIYSLELANLKNCTKWTNDFLDKFLVEKEYYKNFVENISIESWNELINRIKYKPFIKVENEYYILLQQKFYDNFDKIAVQGMCENLKRKEQQELRKKYTSNVEKVVADYFSKILNSKGIYINNYYDYEKKIIENDILILYDNDIFIIEVKSGSFTPELAINDLESHKKSLQDLIKKANEQQDKLEKCLIEKKRVSIYDSNNKRNRNKKAEVEINDDTRIFKIIITAEAFNDIEARIDKVKLISLSKNTLVLCLDDLRVYSDYFKQHPCYFIQYLLQRKKAIGNKNVDLYDELYHLGMWIEYNYYNENVNRQVNNLIKEENIEQGLGIVAICGEDWMKELDEYYNNLWFKKKKITKPYREIPVEIKKIIDYCENNSSIRKHTYLTTFLLNLDPNTLHQTEKIIIESREFYKNNSRPKYRIYVAEEKR